MLHFNSTLWMIFFQTVKPLTDNTGLVIILFSIFFGIGFSFLTFFYRKGKVHYLGVLDGLYLVSVYYMLRQLPLIHPRIHRALVTVSSIIKASSTYSSNFQEASGITIRKTSDIVYYLYSLSSNELEKWFHVDPEILYRKLYTAFEHSRDFFGYVDTKVIWLSDLFYFIPFVILMLIMARNGFKETMQITTAKDTVWFIGLNFIYLVISMTVFLTGIKGCVLAFNVLCLTSMYPAASFQLIIAMGIGTVLSKLLSLTGMTFPIYIGAMIAAACIRNLGEYGGKFTVYMGEINDIGGICLSLFLGMAMITLKIWQLAELALPLVVLLAGQTLFMILYSFVIVYNVMGRDYDAAVIVSGTCGFGMGATPNAMANMQAVCDKYSPSVKAYLLIPLVGSLFADFINSLVITVFINFI